MVAHGCSTVVLVGITCPATTVGTVASRALVTVREPLSRGRNNGGLRFARRCTATGRWARRPRLIRSGHLRPRCHAPQVPEPERHHQHPAGTLRPHAEPLESVRPWDERRSGLCRLFPGAETTAVCGLRAGARQRVTVGGCVARGSSAVGVCALAAVPRRSLDQDAVTSIPPGLFDLTPSLATL